MPSKIGFPEDDERDLEAELAETENGMAVMEREMRMMGEHRHHLRKQISKRQIDPLVAKALELAQNLGHANGANEALFGRLKKLEKRIDVRDQELSRTDDRDVWKRRAEAAEATIERSKKLKSRRR